MSRPKQLTTEQVLDRGIYFDETGWWFDYDYTEGHDLHYYYGVIRDIPTRITFIERDGDYFSFHDEWVLGGEISNVSISKPGDDLSGWYVVEVMTKTGMFHRYTPDYILEKFDRKVYDKLSEDICWQRFSVADSREDLHNWLGATPTYVPTRQWDIKYVEKFLKHNGPDRGGNETVRCGNDPVNHPSHYKTSSGLEAIDVIDAFTEDLKGYECTYTSQVLKYTLRWKHKNGLEDLEKANWYLTRLINKLKEAQK